MACGCPVIATRTGGFLDTVVPGLTGELVPVDSPRALANALTGFLRSPHKAAWQGANGQIWTRRRFDAAHVYSRLYEVVTRGADSIAAPSGPVTEQWRGVAIEEALPAIEALLGAPIEAFENVSGRTQTSVRVTVGGRPLHVKIVTPRPQRLSTIFPFPPRLNPAVRPAEIIARYQALDGSALAPRLLATCDETGLLVTEWCDPAEEVTVVAGMALMREFSAFGAELADPAALARYAEVLAALAARGDEAALGALDDASAEANLPLTGGVARFHRTHPQAELLRIALHARRGTWALAPDLAARTLGVVETFLHAQPIVVAPAELCHGSLKPVHVLQGPGRAVTCDLDSAIFAVGPLDLIHWLYSDGRLFDKPLPFAVAELRGFIPDPREFTLAVAWLLTFVLHDLLDRTVKGDDERAKTYARYLVGFPEALFRGGLTPSPARGDGYGPA
jgi:hypothetical protein